MQVFWRFPLITSLVVAVYSVPATPVALARQHNADLAPKTNAIKTIATPQSWAESASTTLPSQPDHTPDNASLPAAKNPESQNTSISSGSSPEKTPSFNTRFTREFPNRQWWLKFGDAHLESYIIEAVQNSPRLEASLERIKQARAQVSITFAKQLPSLSFSPQYLRAGLSNSISGGVLPNSIQAFILSFVPSYEVDLFGKNRNRTQSVKRELAAVELDNKALIISLEGEVAASYFNLLRADELVDSQEANLVVLKQINEMKRYQYKAGLSNYDEVVRSERDVAQALTAINHYKQQQALFAHQLAVLVGRPPNTQDKLIRGTLAQITLPSETETGIPSDLIFRRPDIVANEQRLQRAAIDIKVARKAFLPSINLSAFLSTAGGKIGDLINRDHFTDIEIAQISQPIFQGGRLVGESQYQKARQREQVANYRQSLLTALKEVEDQLAQLKFNYENMNSNTQRLELTQSSLHIIELQQRQGLAPRLNVLQVQSEMSQYQQLNTSSKADALISTVNLFKALGGGY